MTTHTLCMQQQQLACLLVLSFFYLVAQSKSSMPFLFFVITLFQFGCIPAFYYEICPFRRALFFPPLMVGPMFSIVHYYSAFSLKFCLLNSQASILCTCFVYKCQFDILAMANALFSNLCCLLSYIFLHIR